MDGLYLRAKTIRAMADESIIHSRDIIDSFPRSIDSIHSRDRVIVYSKKNTTK